MTPACKSCGGTLVMYRGCCPTCYVKLWREVRARRTTWADLETAGKCDAGKRRGRLPFAEKKRR